MSIRLLAHSIRMILGNLSDVLRLSSPILIVQILALFVVGPIYFVGDVQTFGADAAGSYALFQFLTVIVTLQVAVAWHRFILLEEYPKGVLPPFHGGRMLAYLGNSFLMGLVVGIPIVLASLFIVMLAGAVPFIIVIIPVLSVAASWAFYRLSPVLPGSAINRPIKFGEAWEVTAPYSGAILGAMLLFVLGAFALGYVGGQIFLAIPILGAALLLILNWFALLLGVSILTTLYGVAVEGRSI